MMKYTSVIPHLHTATSTLWGILPAIGSCTTRPPCSGRVCMSLVLRLLGIYLLLARKETHEEFAYLIKEMGRSCSCIYSTTPYITPDFNCSLLGDCEGMHAGLYFTRDRPLRSRDTMWLARSSHAPSLPSTLPIMSVCSSSCLPAQHLPE